MFGIIEFYRSSANPSGCLRIWDIWHIKNLFHEVSYSGNSPLRRLEVTCSKPKTALLGVFQKLSIDRMHFDTFCSIFKIFDFYRSSANPSRCLQEWDISHISYLYNEVSMNKIFRLSRLELTNGNRKTAFLGVSYRLSMYR